MKKRGWIKLQQIYNSTETYRTSFLSLLFIQISKLNFSLVKDIWKVFVGKICPKVTRVCFYFIFIQYRIKIFSFTNIGLSVNFYA